jgi:hypothetical protein
VIGIPFTVRRTGERGVDDAVIYLTSRRVGDVGREMRAALREYHDGLQAHGTASMRVAAVMAKAMKAEQDGVALDLAALLDEQERHVAAGAQASERAIQASARVARLALLANYGEQQADEIVDRLTDRELRAICETVELGAMPRDFFTSGDTQPKPSTTGPSGLSPESAS